MVRMVWHKDISEKLFSYLAMANPAERLAQAGSDDEENKNSDIQLS